MRILQKTLDALKAQGITAKWYPENTYEEFQKRMWKKRYDFAYNYSKDNVRGSEATKNGLTNVLFETMEEFENSCKDFADSGLKRECDPYEFDTLYIEHDNGTMLVKKEPVKSKLITEEYVLKLVEKNRKLYKGTYGEFTKRMTAICKKLGYNNLSVYPTTYGIGVWCFFNWHLDEQKTNVESILKKAGIEYYNEYSDKRWVFRFKISKKRENLEKIFKVA